MNIRSTISIVWYSLILRAIESRDGTDKFVISYVENERTSSMVVFNNICWKNSVKVKLIKELSHVGIRSASSIPVKISLQDNTMLFLIDLDCPGFEEMFHNAMRHNLHKLPYRWLVLTSAPVNTTSPWWHQFLVNSDLVVAEGDGQNYKMTEVHKPASTGPLILTPRGVFNRGVLIDVRPYRELYRRRRDLRGATLTMTNVIQDSNATKYHLVEEDRLNLHQDYMGKSNWALAKLSFLMLNATPRAIFNYRYGYLQKGIWTGQIRDLMDQKADIGTNLGMTPQRVQAVSFVDNLDNSKLRFILRKPALSYTSNIFSLAFSFGVWLATAALAAIAALALYLSVRWTQRKDPVTFGDAFLLTMSAVTQQGCEWQTKNLSARIIQWVIFTSLMTLYAAYAANIVVLLQAPSNSINNLAQLAESKLTLGIYDADYSYFLFRESDATDPVRKAITKRVNPKNYPKPFYSLDEGVERVRKGLFAFHVLAQQAYILVEKTWFEMEKCDLVEIDFADYKKLYVPAYKHSPYLELLRVSFKQIREVGIKAAVNFRLEVVKPACKSSVAMFISVGIMEMRAVMLYMIYGVAASVAILLGEILLFHANRFRRQSNIVDRNLITS